MRFIWRLRLCYWLILVYWYMIVKLCNMWFVRALFACAVVLLLWLFICLFVYLIFWSIYA